jgi:hypothetical protein
MVSLSLVVLIVGGCASNPSPKASEPAPSARTSTTMTVTSTTPPTARSSTTSTAATTTTCQPDHLAVSVSAQGGAAGHGQQIVSLVNEGAAACTLYGFPGLGLLDGAGQSVQLAVTRATTAGFAFPAIPETTVTLTPEAEPAAFGMEWINGPASGTYSLQVTPPNDTGYLVVPNQIDYFANNEVSVTPVAPLGQLK